LLKKPLVFLKFYQKTLSSNKMTNICVEEIGMSDEFKKFNLNAFNEEVTKSDYDAKTAEYDNIVPLWMWLLFQVVTSLIVTLPYGGFVAIIVYFILSWADVNKNLKNYCRALLSFIAILLLVVLIVSPSTFPKIFRYIIEGGI